MTGEDLANSSRRALYQDVDNSNLRISDDELLIWINEGILELYRINPTSCYRTEIKCEPPSAILNLQEDLPLVEFMKPAMTDYLVYRFYSKDTQDQENRARAANFYQLFSAKSGSF